jgi:radical SAM protein with 4Fe4S-binding SPASM domain
MMKKAVCWWFGCKPDHEAHRHIDAYGNAVPCLRCHAPDIAYGDLVGDTRHNRTKERLSYWLWYRWWPSKCRACGGRFKCHSNCDGIPF